MARSHICVAVCAIGVWLGAATSAGAVPTTLRVSVTNAGAQATRTSGSGNIAISGSGQFVVFESNAPLVAGDTNGATDVYVRDIVNNTTTRVSVRANGAQFSEGSFSPVAISRGGRWIAYENCAELTFFQCGTVIYNLVTGHVRVRANGTSVKNLAISNRGLYVAEDNGFFSNQGVVRTTVRNGAQRAVDVDVPGAGIDDFSTLAGMSAQGRFILFTHHSAAGLGNRVFVRDMTLRRTRLVSVSSSGRSANANATGNAISADGHVRMFTSTADNLVASDTNGAADVFVRIRGIGKTRRVSVGAHGRQASRRSGGLGLSEDGRFALFWSDASNLVPGDTNRSRDVFVRDLRTGRTARIDLTSTGAQIRAPAAMTNTAAIGAISGDGAWVAWVSHALGIVPGDTNRRPDVFARGPLR